EPFGHAGAGDDDREQVVEVVGDAPREQAQALELLDLREAPLEGGALAIGLSLRLLPPDAARRDRDLAGHAHQVAELVRGRRPAALVAEGAHAEDAERRL